MGNGPESNSTFSAPRKKCAWLSARLRELGICTLVHRAGLKEGVASVFESLNKRSRHSFLASFITLGHFKNFS